MIRYLYLVVAAVLLCLPSKIAMAGSLDSDRQQTFAGGVLDSSDAITLSLTPPDGLAGPQWSVDVNNHSFSQLIKLFPGENTITVNSASGSDSHIVTINVKVPSIRVRLSWDGQKQDYDLYVNDVNWTNKQGDNGGTLDRDSITDESNAVENITYSAAPAGLYKVYVNYYNNNSDQKDEDGDPIDNPLPTKVEVFVNEQSVFSQTLTIQDYKSHGSDLGDGKSTWSVCTLVVHSGTESGGYTVDANSNRDLVPESSPILNRISPRTSYSIDELDGPSNDSSGDLYILVGQSAQFNAIGSINVGTDNEQGGVDIIDEFNSSDYSVADVDALGVVTGIAAGDATITVDESESSSANGVQANQINPAPAQSGSKDKVVHTVDVQLMQSNYPGASAPQEIKAGQTAYITAEPVMPQLTASVIGTPPPGANVTWTLKTSYARRGTRDDKTVSSGPIPATQAWNIGTAIGQNFFGGSATLTYQIDKLPKRSITFSIKGKNPLDADAKAYIVGKQGSYFYAWAIVRHESRQDKKIYNQFNVSGQYAEQANYSADGKDGWGMFQRDGTGGGVPASTQETWNWHVNVDGGVAELGRKKTEAQSYFNAVQRTYPDQYEAPPATTLVSATTVPYLDAAIITLYNGASVTKSLWTGQLDGQGRKVYDTYASCWDFDPTKPAGQRWTGPKPNVNNYLFKIIHDEYEGNQASEE